MTITKLMILNTVLLWFSVASFLSLVAKIHALNQTTCGDTEICFLGSGNQSPNNITCSCSESQCSWSKFADRGNILSNGSVLMWQRTGYGQYICRNGSTVARNIMILPQRQLQSCDTCISTRACMAGGKTYLNFTLLFNESLIDECELVNDTHRMALKVTEQSTSCVELSSDSNYSIQCLLCGNTGRDVNRIINNSNFEDCSGNCKISIIQTSSTAASFAVTSESMAMESSSVLSVTTMTSVLTTSKSTVITSTASSTSVLETTTVTMLIDSPIFGNSTTVNESNVGVIIGGIVGGIMGVILLLLITVVVIYCIMKKPHTRDSRQLAEIRPPANGVVTTKFQDSTKMNRKVNDGSTNTTTVAGTPVTPNDDATAKATLETAAEIEDNPSDDATVKATLETAAEIEDNPSDDATVKATLETAAEIEDNPSDDAIAKATLETAAEIEDNPSDDATAKATLETAAEIEDNPSDDAIAKATLETAAEIEDNPSDDATVKATLETAAEIEDNPSDDATAKTTPETAANIDKPNDDHSNQQSRVKGDNCNSSLTDEKISRLLACNCSELRDAITSLHVTINSHIKFETLTPFLRKYKIFTNDEMEFFASKYHSNSDKVNNLIEWLPRKDDRGIHNFVRALEEAEEHTGHLVIVENLHISLGMS